jgi:Tfp pilus assembly protein PilV
METMKKMNLSNEKGFALIAAIIACLILLAVGMLVINMTAGDLRSSSATVGNKKALAATESGIHRLIQDFNPPAALPYATTDCATNPTNPSYNWQAISSGASAGIDSNTQFAVCAPTASDLPPLSIAGSAIDEWAMMRYSGSLVGKNTSYNSLTKVDIGIGFGPVSMK